MTGRRVEFSFDAGVLTLEDVVRISSDIWSDLAFDQEARAQLKRDGLGLEGVRLTGPSPYRLEMTDAQEMRVWVEDGPTAQTLIDLWRIQIMRGLRPRSLAA